MNKRSQTCLSFSEKHDPAQGLGPCQQFTKRSFDVILALVGISLTWWIIIISWIISSIDTRGNGLFLQWRIGQHGQHFRVIKIKTMRDCNTYSTTVTQAGDPRITRIGSYLRKTKIDELPQLINILAGDMSFVGPRPDVPGFADTLRGDDRIVLSVRPGITGPATLKYRNEEDILRNVHNPEEYNAKTIWPDKVKINREYIENWSLAKDLTYILKTLTR